MSSAVPSLPPTVVPGAEAHAARPESDPVGAVLLCHGFTSTPASMRPWADHLLDAGFEVSVPRLAGHGTTWQEMNRTTWQDWFAGVEAEFLRLADLHGRVNLAALSMGGSLTLLLAERYPEQVGRIALVNPSVGSTDPRMKLTGVLSRFIASVDAIGDDIAKPGVSEGAYTRTPVRAVHSMTKLWRVVRADLDKVTAPLLIFRSLVDHVVDPSSVETILGRVSSPTVSERLLHRSFHVATLDFEAEDIFAESTAFFLEQA